MVSVIMCKHYGIDREGNNEEQMYEYKKEEKYP